jgi:hypothetical protein
MRLAEWIVESCYDCTGESSDPDPVIAECYYFSDRAQVFGGSGGAPRPAQLSLYAMDKPGHTTIYAAPLFIWLRDDTGKAYKKICRPELIKAHGQDHAIAYNEGRERILKRDATVNVLVIDLKEATFQNDAGETVKFYRSKNFAAVASDNIAKMLTTKYHESEPIFKRALTAKPTVPKRRFDQPDVDESEL